jgi:ribose-phosphate pyrophosphokinase
MAKLFSGTAHPQLSSAVSQELKIPLSKAEIIRFDNSEVRVRVEEDVKDEICAIIQPTSNPTDTHLMELFFFCDALERSQAKKVVGIIPYFGYARQNIQHRPGEDVSAHVVIKFLETAGFDEIITFDLHDEATEGIFSVPFKNLSALPTLAKKVREGMDPKNTVVISPDQAGVERARKFADTFFEGGESSVGVVEKKRNLDKIHSSVALALHGDVKDKIVVIVDDIVTSGGTLINATDLCLAQGASKVIAAIVHHDFSPDAPDKIQQSKIEKFYTTDSINLEDKQKFEKLEEISIAPLIAQEIKNHYS